MATVTYISKRKAPKQPMRSDTAVFGAHLGFSSSDGLGAMQAALQEWAEAAEAAFIEGMNEDAKGTLELALKYCPIDTGALRETGKVTHEVHGQNYSFSVQFGDNGVINPKTGQPVDYALFVHEVAASHASPTQWKYLERAIQERKGGASARIAAYVKRALGI